MIKTISTIMLLFVIALPLQAGAKEKMVLVQQSPHYVYDKDGSVDPTHILAIGAGVILGGVAVGSTLSFAGSSLIGAVGGAAAGGYVGYRMDEQIKELREGTAGTGVDVTSVDGGDAILVNLPDGVTFATGSAPTGRCEPSA